MEDFVAGFRETADMYPSAADWIRQQLDTLSPIDHDCSTMKYLAILSKRPAEQDGGQHSIYGLSHG